ncbi:MAG TPA: glycosyltransferase family 2 protein [Opitutaceae bacterium]|nr:glycosyltransferase family 2 protein [Opitutaceae bacterium]
MKLAAVSIIKNEADIVEAFVRHTRAWTDLHLVFDHASTDGTREILCRLVAEGLPLRLYTDDALGNLQQFRSNHLARLAVAEFGADWVIPLDADEILVAPDRPALEAVLGSPGTDRPVSLPMANYYPTSDEPAAEPNPVRRLVHRSSLAGATRKIAIPAALARDPGIEAGKGNHALYRDGTPVPDRPAPPGFHLAHFALRSIGQQVLRVVTAELQKLGRGRAHAGLDVHYRLGFQLLADRPDLFVETLFSSPATLERDPAPYRGGPLRYSASAEDWQRVARALLPFLESLAKSHGDLVDRLPPAQGAATATPEIRPLDVAVPAASADGARFSGFDPVDGLGPPEGPFPGAFLPIFRWGMGPRTVLRISSPVARTGLLRLECATYLDDQSMTVSLDGAAVRSFRFPRTNQKEVIELPLALRAGDNQVAISYGRHFSSEADPRKLAVIFLAIQGG